MNTVENTITSAHFTGKQMDLVRTLGVAIDAGAATSGGNRASSAFQGVAASAAKAEKATAGAGNQINATGAAMNGTKRVGDLLRETFERQSSSMLRLALNAGTATSQLKALASAALQLRGVMALSGSGGSGGGGGNMINVTGTGGPSPQLMLQTSAAARTAASSMQLLYRNGLLTSGMWQGMINGAARAGKAIAAAGSSALGMAGRFGAQYGVLAGVAGAAVATNSVVNSAQAQDRLRNMLEHSTGDLKTAGREIAFVKDLTGRLGLEFETTAQSYGKFVSVGRLSKLTYQEIRDTFEGVANASAVMALSSEESGGAMLALTQMLSKGKVTAEELNQQLAERIPGAVTIMAKAVGVSTAELGRMMERGELLATDVLPKFGAELKKQFGGSAEKNAKSTTGAINELKNAWVDFKLALIDAGFVDVLKKVMGGAVTLFREFGNILGFIKRAFADLKEEFGGGTMGKIIAMAGAIPLGLSDWADSGVKWGTPKPAESFALPESESNIIRMAKFKTRPTGTQDFRAGMENGAKGLMSMSTYTTVDALSKQTEQHMGQLEKAGQETTEAMANNFTDFWSGLVTSGGSAVDKLRSMLSSLAKDIATIFARRTIAEPLAGALSLFASGLFAGSPSVAPSGAASAFGLTGSGNGLAGASVFAGIKHAGGLVGMGGDITRMVHPGLFTNAPRFHSGLAPDEFPAILQRGEAVIPKNQVGGMAAGGAVSITVNVDGSKGGSPEGNQRLGAEIARQIEAVIDQRIARAAMPRGILSNR